MHRFCFFCHFSCFGRVQSLTSDHLFFWLCKSSVFDSDLKNIFLKSFLSMPVNKTGTVTLFLFCLECCSCPSNHSHSTPCLSARGMNVVEGRFKKKTEYIHLPLATHISAAHIVRNFITKRVIFQVVSYSCLTLCDHTIK